MASETAMRWVIVLVIYFFLMSFIVTLVTTISPVSVTEETLTLYTGCGEPRTYYEQYSLDPVGLDDLENGDLVSGIRSEIAVGIIECSISKGVLNNESCSELNGCTWESVDTWWNPFDDETPTCAGVMDYPTVTNDTDTFATYGRTVIEKYTNLDGDETRSVCTHPNVINNETMCEVFSCNWGNYGGLANLDVDDIDVDGKMLKKMWIAVKEMFVFRFDFGFEDSTGDVILTMFIFLLPLLILIGAIVVLIRG